jgi:hypothetical protein
MPGAVELVVMGAMLPAARVNRRHLGRMTAPVH